MTKRTSRGFRIYSDFRDSYGNRVRIQQSSAACMDAVWIFCDGESDGKMLPGDTKPFKSAPHLTIAQAKRVIRALERFVEEASGQSVTEYANEKDIKDALQKQEPDDSQDYLRDAVADGNGIII